MSRVEPLLLRAGDEQRLWAWTRSSTIPAGLAQRARIVLLAAEGASSVEVGRRVGVSLPTVHSWRVRYATGGLAALDDRPRSGRPAVHDEQAVIAATLEPPPAGLGVTHWSVRLLADRLGVSFATVARIWRRWGLKPWKAETFTFSTDPDRVGQRCRAHARTQGPPTRPRPRLGQRPARVGNVAGERPGCRWPQAMSPGLAHPMTCGPRPPMGGKQRGPAAPSPGSRSAGGPGVGVTDLLGDPATLADCVPVRLRPLPDRRVVTRVPPSRPAV